MCGLACIARLDGRDLAPETDFLLGELAGALQHRGPDERELLRDGPVGLAFNRLSLTDPLDGTQPLVSPDGNVVLIANGEIYNHRELAASLPSGITMRTGSDCEVLLHLYQRHGLDFLRHVRGMFAIVLWDRAERRLYLARDRFGIKPLYYHRDSARILISSEIKGLFTDPATPRAFDWERAVAVPDVAAAPRFSEEGVCAWFEGVESVPAATILRIDLSDGRTTHHRYWEFPETADETLGVDAFVGRYRELLEDSVRECATADAELGLFLSGGIDSSIVLALARPHLDEIHTFTALAGGTRDNGDAEHAHWLGRELGVPNHQVIFPHDHVPTPEEWTRLLWQVETPMVGPEIYYKNELHRFARAERPQLRGMLLGAASDEFNGGYSTEIGVDWEGFSSGLREMDRNTLFDRFPKGRHWWTDGESFFADALLTGRGGASVGRDVYQNYIRSEYAKIQQYNVWHEDRTAAGSSIEARVPFLDHRLVELSAAVPVHLRPQLLWDKRILRDAAVSLLPARIAERAKVPFFHGTGTHHAYRMLVRMLRQDGHALVERALAAPGAETYLDATVIHRRLDEFALGRTDSAGVELLTRVINMGLLSDLVQHAPSLADSSAGSVRTALPQNLHPVLDTDDLLNPGRTYNLDMPLIRAPGTELLTDEDGSWYLIRDGQIEFVLDDPTPILALLRATDGTSTLRDVLKATETDLNVVREDLDELVDQRLFALGG